MLSYPRKKKQSVNQATVDSNLRPKGQLAFVAYDNWLVPLRGT